MPDVRADPEKLKQFSKALITAAQQLEQVTKSLSRSLDNSGWDDSERRKFEDDFRQTVRTLGTFTEKLKNQYAPEVQRKAAALEQYRGR